MRIRPLPLAAVLAVGLAVAPSVPALAGSPAAHSISAAPTTVRPGETTTVTGTSDCSDDGYAVTLTYTNPADDIAATTVNGTTDASGEYSQVLTIPEDAVAGADASITSNIASCNAGGAVSSNMVEITIDAYDGTLGVTPTSGPAGTEVSISGANCWGDDIVVVFGDPDFNEFVEVSGVTLNDDRTFSATFTIPDDAGPGEYAFGAECPGTQFEPAAFTVTGTASPQPDPDPDPDPDPTDDGVPTAPPAEPEVTVVNFTG